MAIFYYQMFLSLKQGCNWTLPTQWCWPLIIAKLSRYEQAVALWRYQQASTNCHPTTLAIPWLRDMAELGSRALSDRSASGPSRAVSSFRRSRSRCVARAVVSPSNSSDCGRGLLVGVPILIHILMRRRRKPVAWGAMRFVIEAYRRQQRPSAFGAVAASRSTCLLVLIIGAALARPMLGGGGTGPAPDHAPSTSSSITASPARRTLDFGHRTVVIKEEARQALATLDATRGDRVAIVALGAPAESVVLPPTQDLGAARIAIDGLASTDSPADLVGAFDAVRGTLAKDGTQTGDHHTVGVAHRNP